MQIHPRWWAIAACAATALATTGCGSDSGDSGASNGAKSADGVLIDGRRIPVDGPLKLAVFMPFTGNADIQSRIAYLKGAIRKLPEAKMQVFDAQGDATKQINQLESALSGGRFNAAIAAAVDGQLECNALTKQAPAAGVLVAVPNLPLCGRTGREGAELRAPGTLTFVGGTQQPSYWKAYLSWIAERNPGPQKVVALTDPAAPFPLTANFAKAMAEVTAEHPDFRVVAQEPTDLTVGDAYQKAQAAFQAHPDATVLVTMYSTITQGAVQALKASGRLGKVRIYDKGATSWAVDALRRGTVDATSPERPVTSTATMLRAIVDARAGKAVQPFYNNDGAPTPADAPPSGFTVFTKKTIGDFRAEG